MRRTVAAKRLRGAATTRRRRKPNVPPDDLIRWDEAMADLRAQLVGRPRPVRPKPVVAREAIDGTPPSPFDSRSGRLRRFIYNLVLELKAEKKLSVIRSIVYSLDYEPTKVNFSKNPFYWALYAAKGDGEVEITEKEMSRFATQMIYAERHNVPPELLIGFVYQQGNDQALAEKVRRGTSEGWRLQRKPLGTAGGDE